MSYWRQIKLCMWRETVRLRADPSVPIVTVFANVSSTPCTVANDCLAHGHLVLRGHSYCQYLLQLI
jgi:hypothetical protein